MKRKIWGALIVITILAALIATTTAKEENRVIIGFDMDHKNKITQKFVTNLLKNKKVEHKVLYADNKLKFAVITTKEDIRTLKRLLKHSGVEFIEPDHEFRALGSVKYIPNDFNTFLWETLN